jgi:uncharacterized protein YndB with AHSA1/START domain
MGPGEASCKGVNIDLRVGGRYQIHMASKEGDHIAIGEYQIIEKNKRLCFTWTWKDGDMPDTRVTIEFTDNRNGTTTLTLIHENFPVKEVADKHRAGWTGCLEKLTRFVS